MELLQVTYTTGIPIGARQRPFAVPISFYFSLMTINFPKENIVLNLVASYNTSMGCLEGFYSNLTFDFPYQKLYDGQ